jgi:Alpha/beta hydrolase domain
LRDPSIGAPRERVAFELSFVLFPKTEADRIRSHDPRRSIADRYEDHDDYLARFTNALDKLIQQRWILPQDRSAILQRGEEEWDLATAR